MVKLYYYKAKKNVGDCYSLWLLRKMLPNKRIDYSFEPDIICCGSIIEHKIPKSTLCWGCGLHNVSNFLSPKPYFKNKDVYYAVRGKLTAKMLGLKNATLGDTGLLASVFFKPKTKKEYDFAIVAHRKDVKYFNEKFKDICPVISTTTDDVEGFFNAINKCKFIFSSSLHGLIFSHAFGIPAAHIEHRKLESKKNFKFKDYYSVLDIKYTKQKLTNNLDFVDRFLKKPKQYLPSSACVKKIQTRLLKAFPYKELKSK